MAGYKWVAEVTGTDGGKLAEAEHWDVDSLLNCTLRPYLLSGANITITSHAIAGE
jgi:hypothetical protein